MHRCFVLTFLSFSFCCSFLWSTSLESVGIGIKVSENLYSGKDPDNRAFFKKLKKQGIQTILSVDGAKPNLKLAKEFGMTYIHQPIGYGEVGSDALKTFAKIAKTVKGPMYVHCHHGKHRGPAAMGLIALERKVLDKDQAIKFMEKAGTDPIYKGLWKSVKEHQNFQGELKSHALVPTQDVNSMVDSMVTIDKLFESLSSIYIENRNEVDTDHHKNNLVLLWENFKESKRLPDATVMNQEFENSIQLSQELIDLDHDQYFDRAHQLFLKLKKSCKQCHIDHRN